MTQRRTIKKYEIYCPPDADRAGIKISYTKSRRTISVFGWYDTYVGISDSTILTLREFFDGLGITESDCRKAFASGGGEGAA